MAFAFKVWDQANDGQTMAIRVEDVDELERLSQVCTGPDAAGNWLSLREYLDHSAQAASEPVPYVREADVLWLNRQIAVPTGYSQARRFRVIYTGRQRAGGGFSSQGYCVVDPSWNASLQPHHQQPIAVDWHSGANRDLIVVLP